MKVIIEKLKKLNKKYYLIIGGILFLVIVILIGVNILVKNINIAGLNYDGDMFIDEYESLNNELADGKRKYPKVNITFDDIKYVSIDEILNMLTPGNGLDGTGAIYIGYAECLYCRSAIQVLVDTAKESKIDKIYYLDISEIWDEKQINIDDEVVVKQKAHPRYSELVKRLGVEYTKEYIIYNKNGEEINLGSRRVEAPLVLFVVDGEIVSSHIGTTFSQEDPYIKLNDDQVTWLSEVFGYGLKDVVDGINHFKQLELEEQN